ncbi:MAG TPA: Calx-beta domain-containing protein, partial [Thermoanaerobaculia bacterium]|nr:Calx-beta domain-containing protein [Thermoanaerobaculia bacterium]
MRPSFLLAIAAFVFTSTALAATHVWHGTVDNRFSTAANWTGGPPADDPQADLRFTNDAARTTIYNDIPNLHFRTMVFDHYGFILIGEPFVADDSMIDAGVAIYNDITVSKHLVTAGSTPVVLYGAISGPGDVRIAGDTIFGGAHSNTYAGETILGASLALRKTNGAIAVPGNVRGVSPFVGVAYLGIFAPEQIADSAIVDLSEGSGRLGLLADETIHALLTGSDVSGSSNGQTPTLTLDTLTFNGNARVTANLRIRQRDGLQIAAGKGVSFESVITPPADGLILRGGGNLGWQETFSQPVRIDGPHASIVNTNSDVELVSGSFTGNVRSLTATGGTLADGAKSAGDIRANASTRFELLSSGNFSTMLLNGTLDLGNATLFVDPASAVAGETRTLIRNASSQPVTGTFNGLPEGAIVENRWRISYHGGDGNDVTITDLQHPQPAIAISQNPAQGNVGEPVTITVSLTGPNGTPTGTITLKPGDRPPVELPITNGTATLQATYDAPVSGLTARYDGDTTYSPVSKQFGFNVNYPKPVITSITPSEAPAGSRVMLVIKGTGFYPGSIVTTRTFIPLPLANVISPTEIHQVVDLGSFTTAQSLTFVVWQPNNSALSDGTRFNVRAPSSAAPSMQFDSTSASATVTLGATTAWVSSDATRPTAFIADDDFDTIVRWTWDHLPDAAFAVVDLNNGTFTIKASGAATVAPAALPAHTIVYDSAGYATRFALPATGAWTVLWVRPHLGAWTTSAATIDAMQPLGDSPQHPNVFAQGDIVVFMPRGATGANIPVFASALGKELGADAPGFLKMPSDAIAFAFEAHEADKVAHVPVVRTGGSAGTVSVHYRTLPRTALPNLQYTDVSGVLTFAPGETSKTIDVPLVDDAVFNLGEFDVQLFDASGTTLLEPSQTRVGIDDNDPRPIVSLVGPTTRTVMRGSTPIAMLPLEFGLTGATAMPVTVTAGETTFIFAPGEHRKTVLFPVPPPSDPHRIDVLSFLLLLDGGATSPTRNINISFVPSTLVQVRANDVIAAENAGPAKVTLSLVPPVSHEDFVKIDYQTADGSATAGSDYTSVKGTVTLSEAQPQQTIDIPITDDASVEGDESFTLKLVKESPYNAFIEEENVPVVISDDEVTSRPVLSIASSAPAIETDDLTNAQIEVRLSAASTRPVRVHYTTSDVSATGGIDYQPADDVVTFAPGETVKTISIPVFADDLIESSETFTIRLFAAENATIGVAQSTVTIVDDDQPVP